MVSDIVPAIDALSLKVMLLVLIALIVLIACLAFAITRNRKHKISDDFLEKVIKEDPDLDTLLGPAAPPPAESKAAPQPVPDEAAQQAIEKQLKDAQLQVEAQERLASIGILSAGIAHEIKNPLNFITNFSETSVEIATELKEAVNQALKEADPTTRNPIISLADELVDNCHKIQSHAKRAESIIKNMLIQAHNESVEKELVDINALLEEFVNLAYHGMRAQDNTFNAKIEKHLDPTLPKISVSPQSLGRVFLNLINNALYTIHEKAQTLLEKDPKSTFMPTITVTSEQTKDDIIIKIRDNGDGMTKEIQDKIFERFFTTKPAGHGTGLGLPICHDIVVKEHGGKLSVISTPHEYSEFTIQLPKVMS